MKIEDIFLYSFPLFFFIFMNFFDMMIGVFNIVDLFGYGSISLMVYILIFISKSIGEKEDDKQRKDEISKAV